MEKSLFGQQKGFFFTAIPQMAKKKKLEARLSTLTAIISLMHSWLGPDINTHPEKYDHKWTALWACVN